MEIIIYFCGLELILVGEWDERKNKNWVCEIVAQLNGWLQQEVPAFVKNEDPKHGLYVYRPMKEWIEAQQKERRKL